MDDQPTVKSALRPDVIALFAIAAICFVEGMSHGSELVYRLPEPWWSLVSVVGFVSGIPLVIGYLRHPDRLSPFQKLCGVIGIPVLCMVIASHFARRAVEAFAFTDVVPAEEQIFVPIVGMSSRSIASATVLLDPAAREIRVFVTPDLWLRLDPYRSPGRDCLILIKQSGRNGIKRLMVPGLFDDEIGTIAFRRCSVATTPPPAAPLLPPDRR